MRVHVRMLADLAHVNPTRSLNYYVRVVLVGVMSGVVEIWCLIRCGGTGSDRRACVGSWLWLFGPFGLVVKHGFVLVANRCRVIQ